MRRGIAEERRGSWGAPVPSNVNQKAAGEHAGTPEEVLKRYGLKREGHVYSLESEADLRKKETELQRLGGELDLFRMQQQRMRGPEEQRQFIHELEDLLTQWRREVEDATRGLNRFPRIRGMIMNNVAREAFDELFAFRDQRAADIRQAEDYLTRVQRQPFDPHSKQRLDASVNETQASYDQALEDYRGLFESTRQKYSKLARNDEIRTALDGLGKRERQAQARAVERLQEDREVVQVTHSEPEEEQGRKPEEGIGCDTTE